MATNDELKKALRDQYGNARIGTVVNYVTGKVDVGQRAFSLSKLRAVNDEAIVVNSNSELIQTSQAHAYSMQSQQSSSTSKVAKLGGWPWSKMALEAHTTKSNSQIDTADGLSMTVEMAITGEISLVPKMYTPEELYRCAEPNFQACLRALAEAEDPAAWETAYKNLTRDFGHGFVSKLKLMCWAYGRLGMAEGSTGNEQQYRHGRGIAVRGGKGGASSAKEWANDQQQKNANAKVAATTVAVPETSPCATWVGAWQKAYDGKALSIIMDKPPDVPAPPVTDAKPPELPKKKEPDKAEELPKPKVKETTQLVQYMRLEQMTADGVTNTRWEAYQKQIKDGVEALDKDAIAGDGQLVPAGTSDSAWLEPDQPVKMARETSDLDLGSYGIYGLEFTAYKDVFRSLMGDFCPAPSMASLYFARIHMFIMTRRIIASYLNFLASLPGIITGGYVTVDVDNAFTKSLDEFVTLASGPEASKVNDDNKYRTFVAQFDKILSGNHFRTGWGVYRCFVENFKILSRAPYGFLLTAKDKDRVYCADWSYWKYWRNVNGSWYLKLLDNDTAPALVPHNYSTLVNPSTMGGKSYRVFPIIHGGDKPGIALATYVPPPPDLSYAPTGWCAFKHHSYLYPDSVPDLWTLDLESGSSADQPQFRCKGDQNQELAVYQRDGWFYFDLHANATRLPVTLTPIDFADVGSSGVHGIPMWYEPSFDLIKKSVLAGFEV